MRESERAITEQASAPGTGRRPERHGSGAATAEWVMAALSALLVAAILAYTLREGMAERKGPPILTIHADSVVSTPSGHLVLFTVRNEGSETAAAVQVRGELLRAGEPVEESQATLDFVPEEATRRGALQFSENPTAHELGLRVVGFEYP